MTVLTRGSATKTMSTPDRFFSLLDASGFEPNQVEDEFQIWSVIMTFVASVTATVLLLCFSYEVIYEFCTWKTA